MAIFDFRCNVCGLEEEKLINGTLPAHCGVEMEKLISAPRGLIFKGPGFYATEYGDQARHLEPTHQAQRAAREIKERKLVMANPKHTSERAVNEFKRRREAG